MIDLERFRSQLEEKGVAQVREELALGIYNERRRAVAEAWLEQQDQHLEDQHKRRQIELSQEANDLARNAIERSDAANRESQRANVISIVALGVSLIAILLGLFGFQG